MTARHVFGRERGGIRHRAAEAEACEEPQRAQRPEAVDERDRCRQHAEDQHAADERDASPEAIADEPRERAADHHADHPAREDRRERAARQRPVAHHRRDRDAEQLVVDTVEDDRQRRQEDEQLLPASPIAVVENLADVGLRLRVHAATRYHNAS